jgi:hypothetical protein
MMPFYREKSISNGSFKCLDSGLSEVAFQVQVRLKAGWIPPSTLFQTTG